MHSVYRFYDRNNRLLYVGSSKDPAARSLQHWGAKDMVRVAFIEIEWFEELECALAAEEIAIEREKPEWNLLGASATRSLAKTPLNELQHRVATKNFRPIGPPKEYEIPDDYRDTAVKLWHHGEMREGRWRATYKPAEIEDKIFEDTGVRIKFTLVRDWAKAKVGHTRRNPSK